MSGKETRGEKVKKKVSIKEANADNEEKNPTRNESNEKGTSSGGSNTSEPTNIKREIREIIENFGKSHSEPIFKSEQPPPVKVDTSSYVRQFTFTESLTRTSGDTDVCDETRDCNEDTTLDGKIIEYTGESHDCQSLEEVEPIPEHYTVEEDNGRQFHKCEGQGYKGVCDDSIPLKVDKVLQHEEMCPRESRTDTEDGANHICYCDRNSVSERGYTDRKPPPGGFVQEYYTPSGKSLIGDLSVMYVKATKGWCGWVRFAPRSYYGEGYSYTNPVLPCFMHFTSQDYRQNNELTLSPRDYFSYQHVNRTLLM